MSRLCSAPTTARSPSVRIGELTMEELKKIDEVAYIRFASVYRQFADVKVSLMN